MMAIDQRRTLPGAGTMSLERAPAAGTPADSRRPVGLLKLAWLLNGLAALLVWLGTDGTSDLLARLSLDHGGLAIFLMGATSGALADASAGLIRSGRGLKRRSGRVAGCDLLVGFSIVCLVVSVICLVLGIAAATTGLLERIHEVEGSPKAIPFNLVLL